MKLTTWPADICAGPNRAVSRVYRCGGVLSRTKNVQNKERVTEKCTSGKQAARHHASKAAAVT
eukprot:12895312-Prorocentrum_lima.AAC.1